MAQRDQQHLCSTGTQVPSQAWHSELRIQHCHSCSVGCNCSSDLIPVSSTLYVTGWPKKKKKKKKKKTLSINVYSNPQPQLSYPGLCSQLMTELGLKSLCPGKGSGKIVFLVHVRPSPPLLEKAEHGKNVCRAGRKGSVNQHLP